MGLDWSVPGPAGRSKSIKGVKAVKVYYIKLPGFLRNILKKIWG